MGGESLVKEMKLMNGDGFTSWLLEWLLLLLLWLGARPFGY